MDELFKSLSINQNNDDEITKLFKNINLNVNRRENVNIRRIKDKKQSKNLKSNESNICKKPTYNDKYTKNYRKKSPLRITYKGICIKCKKKINKTITNKFLKKKVSICNTCYNEEACINCLKKDMDCYCDDCLTTYI